MTAQQRGGPPKNEAGPATGPAPTTTLGIAHSSELHRAQDGFAAPTSEDRAVAQAIAVLRQHGYGIALRCVDCQHPISSAASLARMRGPKCAARAGVA